MHPASGSGDARTPARLLVACLRDDPEGRIEERLASLDEARWGDLVREAHRHGVAALLDHRLASTGAHFIPSEARRRLRAIRAHCRLRASVLRTSMRELAAAASEAGVQVVALKGAHLATRVYPEPGLRPMEDIDLLVRPHELGRLQAELNRRGYRGVPYDLDYALMHHARPMSKPGRYPVELHRRLSRTGGRLTVDLDGIRERAETAGAGLDGLRFMATGDLLLHLCTHAAHDNRFRMGLLSLCDVDAVVRRIQGTNAWEALVGTANQDGRAPFVRAMLLLARETLATPLPAAVERLERGADEERMVGMALENLLDPALDVPTVLRRMGSDLGPLARLGVMARTVFPSPRRMRQIYDADASFSRLTYLYAARPLDLLRRRGADGLSLVVGTGRGKRMRAHEARRRALERWVGR